MNINMLKYLVELAGYEVNPINTNDFFMKFPKSQSTYSDLKALKSMGLITILNAEDDIDEIGVNQSAIDLVKNQ